MKDDILHITTHYRGRGFLMYKDVGMRKRYSGHEVCEFWPSRKLDGGQKDDGYIAGCLRAGYAKFYTLCVFDYGDAQVFWIRELVGAGASCFVHKFTIHSFHVLITAVIIYTGFTHLFQKKRVRRPDS